MIDAMSDLIIVVSLNARTQQLVGYIDAGEIVSK
jgi:hypothetical protein